jgi:hypothetical protein
MTLGEISFEIQFGIRLSHGHATQIHASVNDVAAPIS